MNRQSIRRTSWAAAAAALLVGAACGGGDDGDEAGEDPDNVLDAALLTEEDVEGLEAEAHEEWTNPLESCGDTGRELQEPVDTRTVGFGAPSREGVRFESVFQSLAEFPDEDAAVAYADTLGDELTDCAREAAPTGGSLVLDEVGDLDLGDADVGDHASGWAMTYEPSEPIDPALISGMELVVVQRGTVVATVYQFVPFPDLDIAGLAETTYERLPD